MADITKAAARLASKPDNQYRLQEFENRDGGYSVALVDNESGSITLQANASDAKGARERLRKAIEEDRNLILVDEAIPPKAEEIDVPDAPDAPREGTQGQADKEKARRVNRDRAIAVEANRRNQVEAGRVRDGYVELGEGDGTTPEAPTQSDQAPSRQNKNK